MAQRAMQPPALSPYNATSEERFTTTTSLHFGAPSPTTNRAFAGARADEPFRGTLPTGAAGAVNPPSSPLTFERSSDATLHRGWAPSEYSRGSPETTKPAALHVPRLPGLDRDNVALVIPGHEDPLHFTSASHYAQGTGTPSKTFIPALTITHLKEHPALGAIGEAKDLEGTLRLQGSPKMSDWVVSTHEREGSPRK
jgi:hypothetical protein